MSEETVALWYWRRYYDHRFVGRAHYVGKPGVWVLKDVKPREGAVDPRELAEIPRRIPR